MDLATTIALLVTLGVVAAVYVGTTYRDWFPVHGAVWCPVDVRVKRGRFYVSDRATGNTWFIEPTQASASSFYEQYPQRTNVMLKYAPHSGVAQDGVIRFGENGEFIPVLLYPHHITTPPDD